MVTVGNDQLISGGVDGFISFASQKFQHFEDLYRVVSTENDGIRIPWVETNVCYHTVDRRRFCGHYCRKLNEMTVETVLEDFVVGKRHRALSITFDDYKRVAVLRELHVDALSELLGRSFHYLSSSKVCCCFVRSQLISLPQACFLKAQQIIV
jgi:hypothetical protein